ncbi:MAG TPA: M48 family metalloprotease [Pirellulales bacterium]|nr:M48 family metalloprotease [Pirellulales bacterium]
MKSYFFGGLAVGGVILGAILIIRNESEKMGETVRDVARETRKELVHDAVKDGIAGAVDTVSEGPDAIAGAIGEVLGSQTDDDNDRKEPGPRERSRDKEKQKGTTATASGTEERPKNTRPAMTPEDAITSAFDVFHKVSKVGDDLGQEVVGLNIEEEKLWGARFADSMRQQYRVLDDKQAVERIRRLAAPLLKRCRRSELDYDFTVLDEEEINAASLLGGYIFVNKGLLDFATGDAELQFALGHEIGHVDLKHCVKRTSYAVRATQLASVTAGQLTSILHGLIASGYSEDQEYAADEWVARGMMAVGRTPTEILAFTKRFQQFLDEHGSNTSSPDKSAGVVRALDREVGFHFRTHPPNRERLLRLEEITADK